MVFRGTGGIIGQDYVSRVCQGAADLVEEFNPVWPATMGGLPVGAAGSLGDKSMQRAVNIAVADAKQLIDAKLAAEPDRGIVIGGYSAGAVVAAWVRAWVEQKYPRNYVCSFSFGDPTRPAGGAFYAGTPAPGRGISSTRYGNVYDWRHCWLANPGDMYTSVPDNHTGDIMQDAYDMVTRFELTDPIGTAVAIAQKVPEMVTGALTDPIAAFQAIRIATGFVATNPPTLPHITYEFAEAWPGQTYLSLAIQHVRDWSLRAMAA
ncbi:hypothetical protein A7G45_00490 [Mycolicibacterium llatzerense]|nr:hypothetical protein [Mycolicibacterium llatzerense]